MHLFDELQDSTFELFAIRNYYSPRCVDAEEFYEDLNNALDKYLDDHKDGHPSHRGYAPFLPHPEH